MITVSQLIWVFFGVSRASIIISSIGEIRSIIVSITFGITIEGINDVCTKNCVVDIFEILIEISRSILRFLESVRPASLSVAWGE